MQVRTTLDESTLRNCAAGLYGGNLTVEAETKSTNRKGVSTYRVKIGVQDSRGPGSRTSWSGRHGPWACWHAFRDYFREVFSRDPDAVVITALARYNGSEGFEREYPRTAYRNIGSEVRPAYMPDMCDCWM